MATHELKTWPEFFEAVWQGRKTAELRKADRDFQVGDYLLLREYAPHDDATGTYSGRDIRAEVTHVVRGPAFGLEAGHAMLSMRLIGRMMPAQCDRED